MQTCSGKVQFKISKASFLLGKVQRNMLQVTPMTMSTLLNKGLERMAPYTCKIRPQNSRLNLEKLAPKLASKEVFISCLEYVKINVRNNFKEGALK